MNTCRNMSKETEKQVYAMARSVKDKRKRPSSATLPRLVDESRALLVVASAQAHGLTAGGPRIHAALCLDILRRGQARGITPSDQAVEQMVRLLA